MRRVLRVMWFCLITAFAWGAAKPHIVSFGKWALVKRFAGDGEDRPVEMKVRPLFVDTRLKEFTLGAPHDVTDRIFVVRRAFRLNDALPDDPTIPLWTWQLGGWLMVDRVSGKVSPLNLPEFDVQTSIAAWYRDYVAYCGFSNDGKKSLGIVAQLGRHKPILRKPLEDATVSAPAVECSAPVWQRHPSRVTFGEGGTKTTYAIHGTIVDLITDDDDEADGE